MQGECSFKPPYSVADVLAVAARLVALARAAASVLLVPAPVMAAHPLSRARARSLVVAARLAAPVKVVASVLLVPAPAMAALRP